MNGLKWTESGVAVMVLAVRGCSASASTSNWKDLYFHDGDSKVDNDFPGPWIVPRFLVSVGERRFRRRRRRLFASHSRL